MWNVSSSVADTLFDISSWVLIAGAFAVFVGTIGSITMGTAKGYFANERLVANEASTARAHAEAEIAKEGSAKANARALEAQLALERYKAPRELTSEQQETLIKEMAPFKGQKYSFNVFAEPEAIALMRVLDNVLKRAGWVHISSQVGDLVIEDAGISNNSGVQVGIKREAPEQVKSIAVRLSNFLTSIGLPATTSYFADLKVPDAINIVVGKKP